MASSKGTSEPKFTGTGKRAGVLGPSTKIANSKEGKGGQARKPAGDGKLSPNSKPGKNAKSFGQGKATDSRSARKGN